jgi:alpha-aminoadipic semialdehyde synthase
MVPSVAKAKDIVRDISAFIATNGLPPAITPMVFGFTGSGNVSNGAREIFELLPHEYVGSSALASITSASPSRWSNKLVGCMLQPQDMVLSPAGSSTFTNAEYTTPLPSDSRNCIHSLTIPCRYFANPAGYSPVFHRNVLPHLSVLVNGM